MLSDISSTSHGFVEDDAHLVAHSRVVDGLRTMNDPQILKAQLNAEQIWDLARWFSLSLALMRPILIAAAASSPAVDFCGEDFSTWAPSHVAVLDDGQQLQLQLDETSGCGFASRNKYLFGNFEMQLKVAPGNTAGTVTAFYLSSATQNRNELDFEFLGNLSGQPYLLQTNIFLNGTGYREQRISLWFDPTTDFHTYSTSWTKQQVVFSVDGTPIRIFPNDEASGMLYVDKPMGVFFSIWNGDDWATEGGLVKINWTDAPFIANYQNFRKDGACLYTQDSASSCTQNPEAAQATLVDLSRLKWVRNNFMKYDYCTDRARYSVNAAECNNVFSALSSQH